MKLTLWGLLKTATVESCAPHSREDNGKRSGKAPPIGGGFRRGANGSSLACDRTRDRARRNNCRPQPRHWPRAMAGIGK
jgi:hypothetical protein